MHLHTSRHSLEIAIERGSLFLKIGRWECHLYLSRRSNNEPGWWCSHEGKGVSEGRIGPLAWCAFAG